MKKSKFGNIQTIVDGHKFPSKKEAKRYNELKLLERAKKIKNLALQQVFIFGEAEKFLKNSRGQPITYVADFVYFDCDRETIIVEDAKGFKTDVYKIKKALMLFFHGIEIHEV